MPNVVLKKNKTVEVYENKRNLFPALSFYIQRVTEELFTILSDKELTKRDGNSFILKDKKF